MAVARATACLTRRRAEVGPADRLCINRAADTPAAPGTRGVIAAQSEARIDAAGVIQEPPTQTTFGSARNSDAFARLIPPVGQNFACGKGPARALSISTPPA